jgi:hypothetical protein
MSISAKKQKPVVYQCPRCKHVHAIDMSQERVDETAKRKHEWVGQPDLARVGEVGVWGDKREWVGLEQVEIMGMTCECVDDGTFNMDCAYDFARAIEARLKEKNT